MICAEIHLQRSAFVRAVEKYGKLDIVVNNAGVVDEINWQRTVNVNLVFDITLRVYDIVCVCYLIDSCNPRNVPWN